MKETLTDSLSNAAYRALCETLVRYTEKPLRYDETIFTFRAISDGGSYLNLRTAIEAGYYAREALYHYGARPGVSANNPVNESGYIVPRWYNLTGKGAAIIEWWVALGYDAAAIEEGRYPPQEWEYEIEWDDYIIPVKRKMHERRGSRKRTMGQTRACEKDPNENVTIRARKLRRVGGG